MPASKGSDPFAKLYPAATLDDQEAIENMEAEPIVLGPGPYSSPDPETDGIRMLPLEDQGSGGTVGMAAEMEAASATSDKDLNAGQWKDLVEAAESEEELDAVEQRYLDAEADYSTVESAIEAKRESF